MRRLLLSLALLAMSVVGIYAATTFAGHSPGALHSDNMSLVANFSEGGAYRNGTDMAFWGDTLLLGNLDQGTGPNASPPGGFRVMDISDPAAPRKTGQFTCLGDQSDISVWEDIVVLSVDKPTFANCASGDNTWEGLRIISIADPANPRILGTVRTDCGSHTNTIYPDLENDRLIVYVLSYPLAGRYNPATSLPTCNAVSHRKISVVEVPLG
ncbi:MAG TPA: hypothetical protein VNT32_08520, partial [Thermoleophilaceae bacterium]|nr:hypothetical protein [Thermoleophilaceae bacterium]